MTKPLHARLRATPVLRSCVLFALAALLAVFARPSHAADAAKGKKIAYLQSLATHPYVATTTKSFRARAEALGMEITFFTSMLDAALQAQQLGKVAVAVDA